MSRHKLNEIVLFQPNLDKIDWKEMTCKPEEATECKIVGVSFREGKVLYDLAIKDSESTFYEILPFCNVDSCFVCPR